MLSPSRGPERLVRAGQWAIAVLFAWFLIQVGASLIADLPLLSRAPQPAQFRQASALQTVQNQIDPLQTQRQRLEVQLGVRQPWRRWWLCCPGVMPCPTS